MWECRRDKNTICKISHFTLIFLIITLIFLCLLFDFDNIKSDNIKIFVVFTIFVITDVLIFQA